MSREREVPESWRVFKQRVQSRSSWSSRWKFPFACIEWASEWTVFWLRRWAFLEILGFAATASILIPLWQYATTADERRKQQHYQAWQVINSAHGKWGNGGRVDALQDLNRNCISFDGIDLRGAYLPDVQLPGADLSQSVLDSARLSYANLQNAWLYGASLKGADFSAADLRGAGFTSLEQLQQAANLYAANVDGIGEPLEEWAVSRGAVALRSTREWEEFKASHILQYRRERHLRPVAEDIPKCRPKVRDTFYGSAPRYEPAD